MKRITKEEEKVKKSTTIKTRQKKFQVLDSEEKKSFQHSLKTSMVPENELRESVNKLSSNTATVMCTRTEGNV